MPVLTRVFRRQVNYSRLSSLATPVPNHRTAVIGAANLSGADKRAAAGVGKGRAASPAVSEYGHTPLHPLPFSHPLVVS